MTPVPSIPHSLLFREDTPIEVYHVRGREVFVKREDLYGVPPAPPLGKLRGLRRLFRRLHGDGCRLVGCWDTRISKRAQGVAPASQELPGMRCIVGYPRPQGTCDPEPVRRAAELGAEVFRAPAGRITISFARTRAHVAARGGFLLPLRVELS